MMRVDLSLMGLLNGNFFNFLTVFSLIVLLLLKLDVATKLENAKNEIIKLINKSEDDKVLSEKSFESAQIEVENLPQEIEKIKVDAQNTIEAYKRTVEADIEKTEQKLQANAQKIIDNETLRINNSLQKELSFAAINMAHQKTLENLQNNNELHRKFIADAINKLEEIEI